MKMNLNLTVTDEQRNALACLLAGKDVKRLASRDDVAGYVLGLMAGLTPLPKATITFDVDCVVNGVEVAAGTTIPTPLTPEGERVRDLTQRRTLTQAEARKHDELLAAGNPEGFARGYINASRRWFNGRL